MARINPASLRAQLDDCRARFDAIKQKGEASADTFALINALFMLVDTVVAVFLEKTTRKTSRNSSLPSSRDGTDEGETHTAGRSGSRGPKARHARSDTLRKVTTTHTSPVTEQWHSSRAFCIVVHRVCWIMYCGYLCFLRCCCGHSPGVNLPSRSLHSVAWIAHYGEVFGWTPESRRCGRRPFSVVV